MCGCVCVWGGVGGVGGGGGVEGWKGLWGGRGGGGKEGAVESVCRVFFLTAAFVRVWCVS